MIAIKESLLRAGYSAGVIIVSAYLVGLAGYFVLRLLIGDRHWALAFLNNISIYLIIPLLVAVPAALALRTRPLSITALGLTLICIVWLAPYFIPQIAKKPAGTTLKVITFNMYGGNQTQAQVTDWLRAMDADIVFLQEVPDSYAGSGFIALKDVYPYQYRQETPLRYWSNAVLSRTPIESITDLDPRDDLPSTRQRMEITVEGQSIALYSIHLTYTARAEPRASTSSPLVRSASAYDDSKRNVEVDQLLAELDQEDLPYIVTGDFNMSAQAVTYRKLASKMGDSFLEAGYGIGGTWPVREIMNYPAFVPPLLRIDYIWHSDHFRAAESKVGPALGSDHLPVFAVLVSAP